MLLSNTLENQKDTLISTFGSDSQTQLDVLQLIQEKRTLPIITVVGDMTVYKYEVLQELFGIQKEMGQISSIQKNFLEIAKPSLSKSLIFNFNFVENNTILDSDRKLFGLVSSFSDMFVLLINAHDVSNSEFYQTIENMLRNSKRNNSSFQKLKIVVIVRVPKNFSRFLEMQDQILHCLKTIELKILQLETSTTQESFFKSEIYTCPDCQEDRFWFQQKIQNVKKVFETDLPTYSLNLLTQPRSVDSSPFMIRTLPKTPQYQENFLRFSETKTSAYSLTPPPYQEREYRTPQRFNESEARNTMDFSYTSAVNHASPSIYESPKRATLKDSTVIMNNFEEVRKKIYRDALFELIEMRNKVKENGIMADFGSKGRIFYEKVLSRFDFETLAFQSMSAFPEKKRLFNEKIHNELHDMFEMQISQLKLDVQNEFQNKISSTLQEGGDSSGVDLVARYNYFSKYTELELQSLLDYSTHKILELLVFPKEEDFRWSHEPIIREIKNELTFQKIKS